MENEIIPIVQGLLGYCIGLQPIDVDMHAYLEEEYGMDSAELTEFAALLEKTFHISIKKADRKIWHNGKAVVESLEKLIAKERNESNETY